MYHTTRNDRCCPQTSCLSGIRPQADDMKDKLGLYQQYKEFWKKHTLPGERRLNVNAFACVPDIRHTSDHMDTLRLYQGYKYYWDKHRIPGEHVRNEVLWEDPWVGCISC